MEARKREVREIMSAPVVTAAASDTLQAAAARMDERRVGCVVVTDASNRPTGILTERDLLRAAAAGAEASIGKTSEWMTADPDTVAPDASVQDALRLLMERGYRHLPVVDETGLIGIVSLRDLIGIAEIRPVGTPAVDVPRGLKGVAVAETTIGDVRGDEGFYHYRQYDATELAARCSFEDVWHLIHRGSLPTPDERRAFDEEVRGLRGIPAEVAELLPSIARTHAGSPLIALRSAYSATAAVLGFGSTLDIDRAALERQALRTCAVFPTLTVALYRLQRGLEPIASNPDLPHAANYLFMLSGREPDPAHARAVEQYLISTIDHGFNASAFTARVIASTRADLGSAVTGALGALSGPLHGGAPSRALDMLDEIGTPENAEPWLRERLERGDRIMGFGHAVYRTEDPRSKLLLGIAQRLGGPRVQLAQAVERRALALLRELRPGRELYSNVEFYASVVLEAAGLPRELFTPTFAVSRVVGWTAHVLEQTEDNRIIRPSARYVGPVPA